MVSSSASRMRSSRRIRAAQQVAEAVDALGELAVGQASARIDIDGLVGASGLEIAREDVGGEVVDARIAASAARASMTGAGLAATSARAIGRVPPLSAAASAASSGGRIMQAAAAYRNAKLAIIQPRPPKTRTIAGEPMDDTVRKISAEDINPRYNWGRALPALGTMGVDFEERVDYRRPLPAEPRQAGAGEIRPRRAARLRRQQHPLHHLDQDRRVGARQAVPLGAALRDGDPILWDFGSAAVHPGSTRPGSSRKTARPGSSACAAPSAPPLG